MGVRVVDWTVDTGLRGNSYVLFKRRVVIGGIKGVPAVVAFWYGLGGSTSTSKGASKSGLPYCVSCVWLFIVPPLLLAS
jgi:hypothetical protein